MNLHRPFKGERLTGKVFLAPAGGPCVVTVEPDANVVVTDPDEGLVVYTHGVLHVKGDRSVVVYQKGGEVYARGPHRVVTYRGVLNAEGCRVDVRGGDAWLTGCTGVIGGKASCFATSSELVARYKASVDVDDESTVVDMTCL